MKKILVKVVRKALPQEVTQKLEVNYRKARLSMLDRYYGRPAKGLKVIAITGTNGKTTTANYINEILKEAGYKTAMFTTAVIEIDGKRKRNDYNATIPPVSVIEKFFAAAKRVKADYVVLEVTAHALDQHKLDNVPIMMAIMTNLTQDHLDYFKDMDHYAAVKGLLFSGEPQYIVLNRDDDWFDYFDKFNAGELKITYGKDKDSSVKISDFKLYKKGTEAHLTINKDRLEVATNLPGEFNVYNMAAAVAATSLLNITTANMQEGIANLEELPGRFERAVQGLSYDVIVDYAHTPDALEKLLRSTKQITPGRVMLVFGATGDRDKAKRPIMGEIAAKNADKIYVTDEENYHEPADEIRKAVMLGVIRGGGELKTTEIADRYKAIETALADARKGDTILITGMGHEVFRIINGKKQPWNDVAVIKEILAEKS
ncbi:UDP-N-acetylmuramoyl-L-alanyl-D-glutamate--2,6-diaminopimelate ligase [Candidatus Saccharibacteria bacterium]|nr:UDP-N-acetylmuramoyl-L-alanyl-D-glutamate--2,6-diaminopimelate ligase [Candidatus Saccharibacteria bacterium]